MPDTADLLAAIRDAFSLSTRPNRFTVESSDDEVLRAEAVFASRTAETIRSSDVGLCAGSPELFLTQQAQYYYMPGFARLVLENKDGFQISDFLWILSPDRIATFDRKQRKSIADVLDLFRNGVGDQDREVIDRRLKRLRT